MLPAGAPLPGWFLARGDGYNEHLDRVRVPPAALLTMPGVTIFCFFASYAVGLGLEMARRWWRYELLRALAFGSVLAGLAAHTMLLLARSRQADLPPLLSSPQDWLLVLAWSLVVLYLIAAAVRPRWPLGVFFLPVVLAFVAIAGLAVSQTGTLPAPRFWGMVHGSMLALGTAAVVAAAVAGMMYLVQSHRLKTKQPVPARDRLPSLERLERLNRFAIGVAFPLLTLGLLSGFVLRPAADGPLDLTDIKVIGTAAAWLATAVLFVSLLVGRSHSPIRGRRMAYLTFVALGLLLFSIVGPDLLPISSAHAAVSGDGQIGRWADGVLVRVLIPFSPHLPTSFTGGAP